MLNPSSAIVLFTDGSAWNKDRSGGWAWVAFDCDDTEMSHSGYVPDTTNNRMEMTACVKGLTAIQLACGSSDVLLYSDSEYVVLGAMQPWRSRRKNTDLWKEIDEAMALHNSVEFIHVRGHHESYYNDLVDVMAGQARKDGRAQSNV